MNSAVTAPLDPWLLVKALEDAAPLDAQFGSPALQMPEELCEPLFGDPDPKADFEAWGGEKNLPPLKTYALLDAACHPALPDILDTSDLNHKCLFTGKALEELGEAAPWLVELEPDHSLTRKLMTTDTAPGGLWEKQLGIFLRSRVDMNSLWKHLRRFTRLRDETGKWYFFRYWSPPICTRLMAMGNHPDVAPLVSAMFPSGTEALSMVVTAPRQAAMLSRAPGTVAPRRGTRVILTPEIRAILRQIRREQEFDDISVVAHRHSAPQTGLTLDESLSELEHLRHKVFEMGFWRRDHIAKICCWELILGPNFISEYANGAIRSILMGAEAAHYAIQDIEKFLDAQAEAQREGLQHIRGDAAHGDTDIWTEI